MSQPDMLTRRQMLVRSVGTVIGGAGAALLSACDRLSQTTWAPKILGAGETASLAAQRLILTRKSMAEEFNEADRSPEFRSNGTAVPRSSKYAALANGGFSEYRLKVDGLVEQPASLSLAEVQALPSRTQITRHGALLETVRPKPEARYVVFHCADAMEMDGSSFYYESIDMEDAFHPQTILAYELNDKMLPVANGAPLRVRVERQLGYKMAKYVMRIELVDSYEKIAGGKGGYWEDQGYEWYAGI